MTAKYQPSSKKSFIVLPYAQLYSMKSALKEQEKKLGVAENIIDVWPRKKGQEDTKWMYTRCWCDTYHRIQDRKSIKAILVNAKKATRSIGEESRLYGF